MNKLAGAASLLLLLALGSGCAMINGGVGQRGEMIPYELYKGETYKNHIEIAGQHGQGQYTSGGQYGIGDPFVMRYNGKYYLYPSSCEDKVRVYESTDLVHWDYKGYATQNADVYFAYAPEVVYYDGRFFMVTSPNGTGHRILESDNPLGPFVLRTDNFKHNIDGSFWITDDDRLGLLYPDSSRIKATEIRMDTLLPANKKIDLNATLRGWTEGPGIFRRGEYFYLTYTGNHVISTGYKVAYSYAKGKDPFGKYVMPQDNVLLIRSESKDTFTGLGHSSNVIGPDLDSIYTAYHNLVGLAGPQRRYCLDRLMTNGGVVYSTGPTDFAVPVPSMPLIYGWLDDPSDAHAKENFEKTDMGVLSKEAVPDSFTVEYNFRLNQGEQGSIDLMFGIDGDSSWLARVDTKENTISLVKAANGEEKVMASGKIQSSGGYTTLCTVRVENTARMTYVYFNGARKIAVENAGITGGKIGIAQHDVQAVYGYVGANGDALGSGDFEAIKNLPGKFAAVHYLKGENRGFNIANAKMNKNGIRYGEKENNVYHKNDGSASLRLDTKGDWVKYAVNIGEAGYYGIDTQMGNASFGAVYEVMVDDDTKQAYRFTIPEVKKDKAELVKTNIGALPLPAGYHTLTVRLVKGVLEVKMFELFAQEKDPPAYKSTFIPSEERSKWLFLGPWKMNSNRISLKGGENAFALTGTSGMTDYSIDCDVVIPQAGSGESGVMFRVTNCSLFEAQVRESFMGYGLSINKKGIVLSKYNYGRVGSSTVVNIDDFKTQEKARLQVEVEGNHIKVFVNGKNTPVLDYWDEYAYTHGSIGFYSFGKELVVERLSISGVKK